MTQIEKTKADAPHYRPSPFPDSFCSNCQYGGPDNYCDMYKFQTRKGWICDSWEKMDQKHEAYVAPAEIQHNARLALKLHKDLPEEKRKLPPEAVTLAQSIANGNLHKDHIDAMCSHFGKCPFPKADSSGDKELARQLHLAHGGRAGRSWAKRVQRMYNVKTEPAHQVGSYRYLIDTSAGATASKSFELHGTISKLNEDKQLVFGWASIIQSDGKPVVDQQGDLILPSDLEEMAYDYVAHCGDGGAMHETMNVSKLVESVVLTAEKQKAMGITDLNTVGWWVGFRVSDGPTWKKVKDGTLRSFSIHGHGHREDVPDALSVATIQQQ